MFSCEFCEISKNTFFTEHLWTAASEKSFIESGKKKKIREYKESQLNIYDYESFPEEFRTGKGNIYLRVIADRNTFR